ncbi:hypothetical protein D3C87_1691870 [compost metagenome]
MIFWRRLALCLELVGQVADDVVILSMDHHQRAGFFGHRHDPQDIEISERQAVIGHEDLEGCITIAHQSRQFLSENLRARIRNDHMERHIGVALAFSLGMVSLNRSPQRLASFLQAEGHDRGVAAHCSGTGRTFENIGHDDAFA